MNSEILDRMPPQSIDDERGVLGSILCLPKVLDDVARIVRPADFYLNCHRRICQALLDMQAAQKPLDIAVLRNWLKLAGDFEAIGGSAYLAEIMTAVPTAAYAVHYAEIVKEKAARRAIIEAGTELLRSAWDEQTEVPEIINQAEASLQGIRTGTFEEAVGSTPRAVR